MSDHIAINDTEGWNSLLQRAHSGNTDAMEEVAFLYENGLSVDGTGIVNVDFERAFAWIRQSAGNGGLGGMVRYADYLSAGEHCKKDVEEAVRLYQIAIERGSAIAARNLGVEYRNRQDFEQAFKLFTKAHELGEPMPLELGLCYYHGIGVDQDKRKSLELFMSMDPDQNAGYDVDEVNYLIGKMFLEGEVVERSIETARHYLELADKDSDHRSANYLLMMIGRNL